MNVIKNTKKKANIVGTTFTSYRNEMKKNETIDYK